MEVLGMNRDQVLLLLPGDTIARWGRVCRVEGSGLGRRVWLRAHDDNPFADIDFDVVRWSNATRQWFLHAQIVSVRQLQLALFE